jgi:hypothetical protein
MLTVAVFKSINLGHIVKTVQASQPFLALLVSQHNIQSISPSDAATISSVNRFVFHNNVYSPVSVPFHLIPCHFCLCPTEQQAKMLLF